MINHCTSNMFGIKMSDKGHIQLWDLANLGQVVRKPANVNPVLNVS